VCSLQTGNRQREREISIEKKGRLQFLSTHSTRKDPHQKSSAGKEYKCC
jgi:hypothetical protein